MIVQRMDLRRLREMVKWWDCPLGMDIRVHRKVDRLSYVGKMAVLVDTQGVSLKTIRKPSTAWAPAPRGMECVSPQSPVNEITAPLR